MWKRILSMISLVLITTVFISSVSVANTSPSINSQGYLAFYNNTEDPSDDVIFDSSDLIKIDNMITEGKSKIANEINTYPFANVQELDTFDNYVNAINKLTNLPENKYFYDTTTTGSVDTLKRYVLENGKYYLCDGSGNKLSEDEQAVDTNNLIAYSTLTQNNLSVGAGGISDKKVVLGNGADNIAYADSIIDDIVSSDRMYSKLISIDSWNTTETGSVTLQKGSYKITPKCNATDVVGNYSYTFKLVETDTVTNSSRTIFSEKGNNQTIVVFLENPTKYTLTTSSSSCKSQMSLTISGILK